MDRNRALELTNIIINTGLNQIEDDKIQKIYLKAIKIVLDYKNVQEKRITELELKLNENEKLKKDKRDLEKGAYNPPPKNEKLTEKPTPPTKKDDFINGFACALITLNDSFDLPIMCLYVINSAGFTRKDFKNVDGYDKEKLKKIFRGRR